MTRVFEALAGFPCKMYRSMLPILFVLMCTVLTTGAATTASASSGVTAISAGVYHSVALKGDGSVVAWGLNVAGETTVPAEASSGVIAITAGFLHTEALKNDGWVVARGNDDYGQSLGPVAVSTGLLERIAVS